MLFLWLIIDFARFINLCELTLYPLKWVQVFKSIIFWFFEFYCRKCTVLRRCSWGLIEDWNLSFLVFYFKASLIDFNTLSLLVMFKFLKLLFALQDSFFIFLKLVSFSAKFKSVLSFFSQGLKLIKQLLPSLLMFLPYLLHNLVIILYNNRKVKRVVRGFRLSELINLNTTWVINLNKGIWIFRRHRLYQFFELLRCVINALIQVTKRFSIRS